MDTENALRRAIERNELRVYYQPEISLATGHVTGVEALLRWEHPERGLLEPASFIPMAEDTGLIVPIGEWVLREACRQGERWRGLAPNGDRFQMSVNLSPRQLSQPDLADTVRTVLEETGTDPRTLCLEITESAVMEDPEFAFATLRMLKELGVNIAIDDFGKGFSSLSHLKQLLPVSELKIDRSFVAGLAHDKCDAAIVAAVMVMATSLGLVAVAEGVETAEQLGELRALGFDVTQGFYFARPQPAEQLEGLIPGRVFVPHGDV
jgi:EAL domain-containing protein (putative c-di-GMP-specific phosphodiesterase class I)